MNIEMNQNRLVIYSDRCVLIEGLVCLFGVYRPTREFFTHVETSALPLKGFKS